MKKIKSLSFILLALTIISCGGRTIPKGAYYGGPGGDSSYKLFFGENGVLEVHQLNNNIPYCSTDGHWSYDKNGNITITDLNNPNCNLVSQLNGTFVICDDPQCIPSGRGYIKGDIRIWPDDKN